MALGIDSTLLAQMRADVAELLPDQAIIQEVVRTSDSRGGWTESYAAVTGGTVACRIDPLDQRGSEVEQQIGRETLVQRYQLTVPYDAPILPDYQVTISSTTYQVLQLFNEHSWNISKRAIVGTIEP